MPSWLRVKLKESSVISKVKCFGHFVVVDHLADPQRDLVLAAQRPFFSPGGRGDLLQLFFGGRQ
jgi:hypothetical protein